MLCRPKCRNVARQLQRNVEIVGRKGAAERRSAKSQASFEGLPENHSLWRWPILRISRVWMSDLQGIQSPDGKSWLRKIEKARMTRATIFIYT